MPKLKSRGIRGSLCSPPSLFDESGAWPRCDLPTHTWWCERTRILKRAVTPARGMSKNMLSSDPAGRDFALASTRIQTQRCSLPPLAFPLPPRVVDFFKSFFLTHSQSVSMHAGMSYAKMAHVATSSSPLTDVWPIRALIQRCMFSTTSSSAALAALLFLPSSLSRTSATFSTSATAAISWFFPNPRAGCPSETKSPCVQRA